MNRLILAFFLLAGCGARDESGANQAAPGKAGATPTGLTGLYESGPANQPDQLCLIDDGDGPARFGLVVWGSDLHSCLGAGEAVRDGDRLTMTMAGDSTCAIDARISGDAVTLPAAVPDGCAYYCGARARFAARTLARKGATAADARKAKDLAGDPLC
jgi:hypothetical protein